MEIYFLILLISSILAGVIPTFTNLFGIFWSYKLLRRYNDYFRKINDKKVSLLVFFISILVFSILRLLKIESVILENFKLLFSDREHNLFSLGKAIFHNDFYGGSLSMFLLSFLIFYYRDYKNDLISEAKRKLKSKIKNGVPDYKVERTQLILGVPGTGKTTYLNDIIESNSSIDSFKIIIDGKADTTEFSLLNNIRAISRDKNQKLIVLSTANHDSKFVYNPFLDCGPQKASEILNIFVTDEEASKSDGAQYYAEVFKTYSLDILTIMQKIGIRYTFNNIVSCLDLKNGILTEAIQRSDFDDSIQELFDEVRELESDVKSKVLQLKRYLISDQGKIFSGTHRIKKEFSVTSAYKNNQNIVALVDVLSMPDFSKVIAKVIIQDVKNLVSKMNAQKIECDKKTLFIMDEFSQFVTESFLPILQLGRSVNLISYLSTQSLSDLKKLDEETQNQIIDNSQYFTIFRQNSSDSAEEISKLIGTQFSVSETARTSWGVSTKEQSNTLENEFIVSPDEIKTLKTHEGYFLDKGTGKIIKFKNKIAQNLTKRRFAVKF